MARAGAGKGVAVVVTFAAAMLSYHLVEMPFLRMKARLRSTGVAGLDAVEREAPAADATAGGRGGRGRGPVAALGAAPAAEGVARRNGARAAGRADGVGRRGVPDAPAGYGRGVAPTFPVPDVLVLAAGGVVGEAWMSGVLAGIEDAGGVDFRRVESFVGTSAGSIVAARLAAGSPPRRPEDGDADAGRRARGARGPAAAVGGRRGGPARAAGGLGRQRAARHRGARGRCARPARCALAAARARSRPAAARSPGSARSSRAAARGSTGACASSPSTGRPGAASSSARPARRRATVGEAVAASCSVPWVFEPIRSAGASTSTAACGR